MVSPGNVMRNEKPDTGLSGRSPISVQSSVRPAHGGSVARITSQLSSARTFSASFISGSTHEAQFICFQVAALPTSHPVCQMVLPIPTLLS